MGPRKQLGDTENEWFEVPVRALLRSSTLRRLFLAAAALLLLCSANAQDAQTCVQQNAASLANQAYRLNSTADYSTYLQQQFNSSDFLACILDRFKKPSVEIVTADVPELVNLLSGYLEQERSLPQSAFAHLDINSFAHVEDFIKGNFNSSYLRPDGYIYDTRSLGALRKWNGSVLTDLSVLLASQQGEDVLHQNDLLLFISNISMNYKGKPVALPFDGDILLLYYRKDVFSRLALDVPHTWEEFLYIASKLQPHAQTGNSSDFIHPFCFSGCKYPQLLVAVAGQYIQYNGTLSGLFYDPYSNMTSLVGNEGMAKALELVYNMKQYMPVQEGACGDVEWDFVSGKCAMTLGWGSTFKASELSPMSSVKGQVLASVLPGSAKILHRPSQQLQDCTRELCPYSTEHGALVVNRAAFAAVNPFTGTYLMSWNAFNPNTTNEAQTAIKFLLHLASPEVSMRLVLDPATPVDPFRASHLRPAAWASANYTPDAAASYLQAVNASLSSSNVLAPLRLPIWRDVDTVLRAAIFQLATSGGSGSGSGGGGGGAASPNFTAMAAALAERLTNVLYNSSIDWKDLVDMYNGTLGHKESMYDKPSNPGGNQSMSLIPAIVIPALLVVFLIVGTSVAVMYIRRDRRRSVLGRIMAPGAGPDTSLVVTDIQDSTTSWEMLPSEVMDRAVKEHHKCMRKYLQKHYGYESTTEGDSFILAFHTAKDALLFAMEVQQALMKIDWPPELLALDHCRVVYAHELKTSYFDPTKLETPHQEFDTGNDQPPQPALPDKNVDVFAWVLGAIRAKEGNAVDAAKVDFQLQAPELQGCYTLKQLLRTTWKETEPSDPQKTLLFRGMRVRMGIHTGVLSETHVHRNQTDSRVHYTGESIQMAKCVSDAAHGGMVTISEATYQKLPMEELFERLQVVHCGEHHLSDDLPLVYIYQMLPRPLMGRLAFQESIRSKMSHSPTTLEAPMGRVTIVFMNIVGVQMLLSWNPEVTKQAIKLFHRAAGEELRKLHGHQVEQANNLFLASFPCQYQAVLWCLETQQRMRKMQWPVELINRELDQEETEAANAAQEEGAPAPADPPAHVYRGLHSKAGIDCSEVRGYINPITGRITYRGKVMNRAARIASIAQKDEVLCSHEVFQSLLETHVPGNTHRDNDIRHALANVEGESRGQQRLKGVSDKMEIIMCRYKQPFAGMGASRRASALGPPQDLDLLYQQQQHMEHVFNSASFISRAAAHFSSLPPEYITSRNFTQTGDTMVHEPQQLMLTDVDLQSINNNSTSMLTQPDMFMLSKPPLGLPPQVAPPPAHSIITLERADAVQIQINPPQPPEERLAAPGAEIQMQPRASTALPPLP